MPPTPSHTIRKKIFVIIISTLSSLSWEGVVGVPSCCDQRPSKWGLSIRWESRPLFTGSNTAVHSCSQLQITLLCWQIQIQMQKTVQIQIWICWCKMHCTTALLGKCSALNWAASLLFKCDVLGSELLAIAWIKHNLPTRQLHLVCCTCCTCCTCTPCSS